jgi:hypothetical protein
VEIVGLNSYLWQKAIVIDDAGWGDLILGVVIGALLLPDHKYMERRIPVSSFQPPHFQNKKYLDDAVQIVQEFLEVMVQNKPVRFKICSGYILSGVRRYLRGRGFPVEEVEIAGELQELVEEGFSKWCEEIGVSREIQGKKRSFWTFLEWVAQNPQNRERIVKTGWKSWQQKWRAKAYEISKTNSTI